MKNWLGLVVLVFVAVAAQVAGLSAGGARELVFGWVIPMTCALLAGALLGVWPGLGFALAVGVAGPELSARYGLDAPDGTINILMTLWLMVPILVGSAALGMLLRIGWDFAVDSDGFRRPSRATSATP